MNGTGLVRDPSSRLAEGIVTHISRTQVDVALARAQHAAYADTLAASGWTVRQVPLADDCPDSVFVEDTVVICEDLAVRPVTEEAGSHVVPLGGDRVLIAASAPRTAEFLRDLGFTPVVVEISEFEKLEGCVTCLSVLLPGR